MRFSGPAKRLCIYIGESDRWQGRALYLALLEALKQAGLAGATVTRGVAGFGAHARIRTASIEVLSTDLPLLVEVVDRPEQIDKALALVGPMVREGLITLEDVEVVKYTHRHLQPLPGDRLVREVMTREVVTVTQDTPLADVMELLIGKLFKAVPVVDQAGRIAGIVTDGDLMARGQAGPRLAVTERLDSEALAAQLQEIRKEGRTAGQVMTAPVVTVREDSPLAHAVSLMTAHNLKRLPVVDAKDRLVGMLSRVDVLRTVATHPGPSESHPQPAMGQTVGEVMDRNVPTVPLDADLADITDLMVDADLKRVIVVDGAGQVVGIISDGDLVARVQPEARPGLLRRLMRRGRTGELPEVTAAQLMSAGVLTASAGTPIAEAIQSMVAERRKRLVVVDAAGKPIGIVGRQMLLHAVAGAAATGRTESST